MFDVLFNTCNKEIERTSDILQGNLEFGENIFVDHRYTAQHCSDNAKKSLIGASQYKIFIPHAAVTDLPGTSINGSPVFAGEGAPVPVAVRGVGYRLDA